MRVIAFVNKNSGGNEGARVLHLLKNLLGHENVFDIIADKGPDRGLDTRAADPTLEVIAFVAGGDGTFSWVATALDKRNLSHCHLAVIPLGSGNDMSRALGWGRKFPRLQAIERWVTDYVNRAEVRRLDVWRLTADAQYTVEGDDKAPSAGSLMCNYLSLGADAYVELRFNQLRWNNPDKYKSRLGNFRAHAMVGAKYMCSAPSGKIYVKDHVMSLLVDGREVDIPEQMQALIFLNIPSYGAGTQPWGVVGRKKPAEGDPTRMVEDMYVDDRRFEVLGLRSLAQFGRIKLLGTHGVRLAQGTTMHLKLKSESTPFQVDGEPWEQRGGEVTIAPGNSVGVLQGPVWKEYSKKNAKFDPNDTASKQQTDADASSVEAQE